MPVGMIYLSEKDIRIALAYWLANEKNTEADPDGLRFAHRLNSNTYGIKRNALVASFEVEDDT